MGDGEGGGCLRQTISGSWGNGTRVYRRNVYIILQLTRTVTIRSISTLKAVGGAACVCVRACARA